MTVKKLARFYWSQKSFMVLCQYMARV